MCSAIVNRGIGERFFFFRIFLFRIRGCRGRDKPRAQCVFFFFFIIYTILFPRRHQRGISVFGFWRATAIR